MAEQNNDNSSGEVRRGFFVKFAAGAIGAVVALAPLVTGLLFFLNPLYKKQPEEDAGAGASDDGGVERDAEGFINLRITADALPADGTPQSYKVHDDKVDAWNKFKNVEIGTVWLRLIGDQVIAFSTICPHLGCAVDYRSGEEDFYCPCHTSKFSLDGKRTNQIPPRDMDKLSVKQHAETGEIWLKYEKFRATIPEQEAI